MARQRSSRKRAVAYRPGTRAHFFAQIAKWRWRLEYGRIRTIAGARCPLEAAARVPAFHLHAALAKLGGGWVERNADSIVVAADSVRARGRRALLRRAILRAARLKEEVTW